MLTRFFFLPCRFQHYKEGKVLLIDVTEYMRTHLVLKSAWSKEETSQQENNKPPLAQMRSRNSGHTSSSDFPLLQTTFNAFAYKTEQLMNQPYSNFHRRKFFTELRYTSLDFTDATLYSRILNRYHERFIIHTSSIRVSIVNAFAIIN